MLIDWLLCPLKLYMNWTPEWQEWTPAAFRIQRKKLLFYSGWVILQRPAALLIILKTQPAVHMWCREKSIRRVRPRGVPESRRALRGRFQFMSLQQKKQTNKNKTHLHDEIYSLIGRGRGDRWQTGGAVHQTGGEAVSHRRELNVSSAIALLLQVYNRVTSPLKYRHNTSRHYSLKWAWRYKYWLFEDKLKKKKKKGQKWSSFQFLQESLKIQFVCDGVN